MTHSELILREEYDIEFILIETSHPGNIGACARAIKNMGFSKLGLVNPKKFPCDEAYHRSKGAKDILDNANIYKSLDEALSKATLVFGTSARERTIPWPASYTHLIDEGMVKNIKDKNNKICILFGREDSGLSNDELQKCHMHLRIPCSEKYSSLNISHAVQIISYEFRNLIMQENSIEVKSDVPLSTDTDNEYLLEHLDKVLIDLDFYDQNSSRQVKARLKRLVKKSKPDKLEVGILRGFLTKIEEMLNK